MAEQAPPTLYWNPFSNNARIVHYAALEMKVPINLQLVDLQKGEHRKPDFLKINPKGQVPGLKHGDVTCFDGSAIIRYLAFTTKSDFYPYHDPERVALIDSLYTSIRGDVYNSLQTRVVKALIAPVFFGAPPDPEGVAASTEKANKELQFYNDTFFKDSDYIVGKTFSLADVALVIAIIHAEFCTKYAIPDTCPKVKKLVETAKATPNFNTVHGQFLQILQSFASQKKESPKEPKTAEEGKKQEKSGNKGAHITLYHIVPARSTRVLWLAYELGLEDINVKVMKWKDIKKPEYLKINPNGVIPGMKVNGTNLWEAGAMINYLLKENPDTSLIPKNWTLENWLTHYKYEWWCIATLDGRLVSKLFGTGAIGNALGGTAKKLFNKLLNDVVIQDLGKNEYINGPEFTITDIYIGYTLGIANILKIVPDGPILDYFKRISSRPHWKHVFADFNKNK